MYRSLPPAHRGCSHPVACCARGRTLRGTSLGPSRKAVGCIVIFRGGNITTLKPHNLLPHPAGTRLWEGPPSAACPARGPRSRGGPRRPHHSSPAAAGPPAGAGSGHGPHGAAAGWRTRLSLPARDSGAPAPLPPPTRGVALSWTGWRLEKRVDQSRPRDLPQATQHRPTLQRPPPCPPTPQARVLGAGCCRYYSHFRKDSRLYSYPIAGQSPKLYNLLPHPKGPSVSLGAWWLPEVLPGGGGGGRSSGWRCRLRARGPGRRVSRGLCAQGAALPETADQDGEGRRGERERGHGCSQEGRGALRRGSQAAGPLPSGQERPWCPQATCAGDAGRKAGVC